MQAKVEEVGIQALIEDYEPIAEESFQLIQGALRLSENALVEDPAQLAATFTENYPMGITTG